MNILTYLQSLLANHGIGSFVRRASGHGMDILDLRKYQVGDAMRHINRKQTAKHGHAIVNVYEDVQEARLQCFLDINYNWVGVFKDPDLRVIVEQFFIELLRHATHLGVRIDICRYADDILSTLPVKHYSHILSIIQTSLLRQQALYVSSIDHFLRDTLTYKKRRGILLLSDFLQAADTVLLHDVQTIFPTSLVAIPLHRLEGKNFVGL